MVGFRMNEVMIGSHRFTGSDEELPMLYHLTWGHENLWSYCDPSSPDFLSAGARGIITVAGLVNRADCRGSLRLLYFTQGKVRYELQFADEQGKQYRYVGEKVNIRPWNLHKSHTTCFGEIFESDTGRLVSKSVVSFPLRELPAFLASLRLVHPHKGEPSENPEQTAACGQSTGMETCKVLSMKEAAILAAMAGGIIPRGGRSFALGAADLEEKWIPRADHMLSRMPAPTRLGFRMSFHLFNYLLPAVFLRKLRSLIGLNEDERTRLFHLMENSAFPGPLAVLITKVLVLPAFYGLPEAKDAIGYKERFPNRNFVRIKD